MRDAFNKTDYRNWKAMISCYNERTVFIRRQQSPFPCISRQVLACVQTLLAEEETSLNSKETEITFRPVLRDCISNHSNFLICCINHSDAVISPEGNDHVIKSQWNWQ